MYPSSFTTDQATFVGFAVEAILYGSYVVLFSLALTVLLRRKTAMRNTVPMLFITATLFFLCTVHFALNFNNVYTGTMVHPRVISAENHLLEGADATFFITDFFAQLVLIYRCWLVWSHSYLVIIFPVLISLSAVSCSLTSLALLTRIEPTATQAPQAIVPLATASFSLSLCLNFIVTSLIVGRIWYVSRSITGGGQRLSARSDGVIAKATGVMIESGLLFLVVQFVFVVLFAIGHSSQAVLVPAAMQIYGIAPTMIIVRVGMGAAFEPTTLVPDSTVRFEKPTSPAATGTTLGRQDFELLSRDAETQDSAPIKQ